MSFWIVPMLVAIIIVAWLTAAATAVRAVSHAWLRNWVTERLAGPVAVHGRLAQPQRLLVGAGAGVAATLTLAGVALGTWSGGLGLVLELLLLSVALLLFGQLLPRAIARRWAPALFPVLEPPLRVVATAMAPLVRAGRAVAAALDRRGSNSAEVTPDEIADLLREGELEGIGEPQEIEIITGIVLFGEKVVRDVMTPRTQVFAVEESMDPREMARAIAQSGYSRVPVYRGSLDEVVGMVHVFDVLAAGGERAAVLRQVVSTPGSKPCSELLFEMLRSQRHLAVVLDEFGGTAGIVTLEDVLEELVGDINDEHDEPAAVEAGVARRAVVFDAKTDLEQVARHFGIEVPGDASTSVQSLGGILLQTVGRIPQVGERFRLDSLELVVVDAERTHVRRVLVQRLESATPVELRLAR
ncbi:MAG TPA: hemolysin family protein [Gemmatimonadaceae bacterium]|nr:hemolysin family protein [Gemmatimonadaceae bacterium]